MSKLSLAFVSGVCLLGLTTLAPDLAGQNPSAKAKLEKLSQELQLTPKQKVEMLPILEQEAPKLEAIKNNSSLSGMQKMQQLRAVHNESAPQLQKILSPQQYQKLQAIRQEEIQRAIERKRAAH